MALFALWRNDALTQPPDRLHRRLAAEAHIVPERTTTLAIETPMGRWQVAAFACATRFLTAEAQVWSAPGQGACLLNGVVWQTKDGVARLLDAEAMAGLISHPDAAQPADLAGEYAVVRLFADGTLLAFSDTAAVHQLFYRPDRPCMVANRAAFLAALVDDWTPDPESGLWLATIGYRVGVSSGWRGVHQLPQGHALVAGRGLRALARPDRFDQPRGFAERGEALLEQGKTEATAAIRLAAGDDPLELPITGGKDSRAVLALALAAGLRERLTLVTRGPAAHPDVRVGQAIATALGLPHRREAPRFSAEPDVAHFVERLAAHSYQTDGGMGGWDLLIGEQPGAETLLTGHMGEVLKSQAKRPSDPADPADMVRRQAPFDPLGLLRPAGREMLLERLNEQRQAALAEGATADDLPDLFYYRNRVPNWLGGIRGVRGHERQPIMPLGVPALQRLAFQLTPAERTSELLHYRLVHDCAPELLALPFAHQRWSAALVGAPDVAPLLADVGAALFGNWQWALNHSPELRAWLSAFFVGSDIPLWKGIDRAALLARLRERRFDYEDVIALLGLAAAAFHQSATVRPIKMGGDVPEARAARSIVPPPVVALAPVSPLRGHVDLIAGAAARSDPDTITLEATGKAILTGWAVAPDWPGAAPEVEARIEGRVVGAARPTRERSDLAVLGLSHTSHGFTLSFDVVDTGSVDTLTVGDAAAPFARFKLAREASG